MLFKRSHILLTSVVVFILAVSAVIIYLHYLHGSIALTGIVDHKSVVGIKNNNYRTLILVTPRSTIVKDPVLRDYISSNGSNIFISPILEYLENIYDDFYCVINVRLSVDDTVNNVKRGETLGYILPRSLCITSFDELDIGSAVTFTINRHSRIVITNIVSYETSSIK